MSRLPAGPGDPRPDLAARFADGPRWRLVLTVFGAADPAAYATLVALRRAGAQISRVAQPGDLTPEGPMPDWRLCAGAIPAAAWPRWRAQAARLAPRLAPWLKLAPQDERGEHARAA